MFPRFKPGQVVRTSDRCASGVHDVILVKFHQLVHDHTWVHPETGQSKRSGNLYDVWELASPRRALGGDYAGYETKFIQETYLTKVVRERANVVKGSSEVAP
jgi:hypothetical protein